MVLRLGSLPIRRSTDRRLPNGALQEIRDLHAEFLKADRSRVDRILLSLLLQHIADHLVSILISGSVTGINLGSAQLDQQKAGAAEHVFPFGVAIGVGGTAPEVGIFGLPRRRREVA